MKKGWKKGKKEGQKEEKMEKKKNRKKGENFFLKRNEKGREIKEKSLVLFSD